MKNIITTLFVTFSLLSIGQSIQIDSSYATNGINKLEIVNGGDDQALLSAVQTDGKLLICGPSYNPSANNTYPFISRYLIDGTLDTTFNNTGKNILTALPSCMPYSMTIQSDGKIIIAGQDYFQGKLRGIVIRFHTNGQLDTTFNSTGYSRTLSSPYHHLGRSVSIQNNKIILAGYIEKSSSNNDFFATRFLNSGIVDSTFGTQGKIEKDFGGIDICRGITVQADNKIILTGFDQTNASPCIIRLLENGSEDVSFNSNWGTSIKYPYSFPYQSIVLDDEKILSLGFSWDSTTTKINLYAVRLLKDGTIDPSFATNGEFIFNLPGEDTYGIYGVQRADGNLVFVGNSGDISTQQMNVFAMGLTINGNIDLNFQDSGIFTHPLSNNYDLLNAVHLGTDSTIIATGYYNIASYTNKPVIIQFKIDGLIDNIAYLNQPVDFSIFPNPVSSGILQFENTSKTDLRISIHNLTGRIVFSNVKVAPGNQINLNIDFLQSGMYFLKAYSETTQELKTRSFVKQ
jgi:uncharacterized delta-60 repeat protein